MKVLVISLRRSVDRRRSVEEHLQQAGVEFEFFDAVDGRAIDHEASQAQGARWKLTPGEVGCYLSHVDVWKRIVSEGLPSALVLEDDALLAPDAWPLIKQCAAWGADWDLIRLSAIEKQVGWRVASLGRGHHLVLPTKSPSGSAGYVVSLAGARRLLAALSVPATPIDTALDEYWAYGLNIPMVVPPLVLHGDVGNASTIDRESHERARRLGFIARLGRSVRRKTMILKVRVRYGLRLPVSPISEA